MKEKQGFHFGRISIINHWTMAILFISVLSLGFLLDFVGAGRAEYLAGCDIDELRCGIARIGITRSELALENSCRYRVFLHK